MAEECNVCKKKDLQYVQVEWCTECQNALCLTCSQWHKHDQNHEILSYSDYLQLPSLIKNLNPTCPAHNENYLYLCREHDQLICNKCLETGHKICKETPVLKDIVGRVKTSNAFESVTSEVEEISMFLQSYIKALQTNLSEIQNQRKEMTRHVEDAVDKIMTELKKLEQNMLSNIDDTVNKVTKDLEITLEKLQTMEAGLREIIDQKQSIKQHATNLQTYFGIKEMEKLIEQTTKNFSEVSKLGCLDYTTVEIDGSKMVELLFNDVQLFGEINITKTTTNQSIDTSKQQTAQNKTYSLPKYTKLQQKIDLGRRCHWACCSVPSGIVVAEDRELKFVNPDGTCKSLIKFKYEKHLKDVTAMDQDHVVTAHQEARIISLVDITRGRVIRSWRTVDLKVAGISYKDGHIIFCVPEKGIMRLNIDTGAIDNVINDKDVGDCSRVVTNRDRICYTCPDIDMVTVLSHQYHVIFKSDKIWMWRDSVGLAIDNYNNVYVTSQNYNCVTVISPDGQKANQLLQSPNKLNRPTGINYNSRTKELIVITCKSGILCKYTLR